MDLNLNNYTNGEPIFIEEFQCSSKNYLRQELKRLTDIGVLARLYNGVYYKKYKTILGTEGKISIDKYINKLYVQKYSGFYTGLTLLNKYGFTTQNPAVIEVASNKATTKQRKNIVDGFTMIIYKPVVKITKDNISALQFLDLMLYIDKYSELDKKERVEKLKEFVSKTNVNFEYVKKYISLYPMCVYKNIYDGGLMNELV